MTWQEAGPDINVEFDPNDVFALDKVISLIMDLQSDSVVNEILKQIAPSFGLTPKNLKSVITRTIRANSSTDPVINSTKTPLFFTP